MNKRQKMKLFKKHKWTDRYRDFIIRGLIKNIKKDIYIETLIQLLSCPSDHISDCSSMNFVRADKDILNFFKPAPLDFCFSFDKVINKETLWDKCKDYLSYTKHSDRLDAYRYAVYMIKEK